MVQVIPREGLRQAPRAAESPTAFDNPHIIYFCT
jgi:hypothetical protein